MQVRYQAALRPDRTGGETLSDLARRPQVARGPYRSCLERGTLLLEPLEQLLQLRLDVVEHQFALGIRKTELDLWCRLLALVEQRPARARDGVAPGVEQLLDAQQQLDLVGPVHAVAGAILLRPQHAELG